MAGKRAGADPAHGQPYQNLVELARSEEALPLSAIAAVPFSELADGCIENFVPCRVLRKKN